MLKNRISRLLLAKEGETKGGGGQTKLDKLKKEREKSIEEMFSDDPPPKKVEPEEKTEPVKPKPNVEPEEKTEPVKPKPNVEPEEKTEPVKPKPNVEPEPGTEPDDDDLDFDTPPGKEKGEPNPESDKVERETIAQQQARENGRLLKNEKLKVTELEAQVATLKKSLEDERKSSRGKRPEDFIDHPEVSALKQRILDDRDALAEIQAVPETVPLVKGRFGDYITTFIAGAAAPTVEEQRALQRKLREDIANDFDAAVAESRGPDFDASELESERKEYVRDMLQLCVRNASNTRAVSDKIHELAKLAQEGVLSQGVEVYKVHSEDLGASIESIRNLPEEAATGDTIEAVVHGLLKDEKWDARFKDIKKQVIEALLGPRALSQEEISHMRENEVDLQGFFKKRSQAWTGKRKKLASMVATTLMIRPLWEETRRKAAMWDALEGEKDAASGGKPVTPPKPEPAPLRPRDRPWAIDELLNEK